MNHTKEPWLTDSTAKFDTQEQVDYHRACICVNACAGSDEDWLDGYAAGLHMGTRKLSLVDQFKLFKAQRDELLSAIKGYLANDGTDKVYDAGEMIKFRAMLILAIAKCEAQS